MLATTSFVFLGLLISLRTLAVMRERKLIILNSIQIGIVLAVIVASTIGVRFYSAKLCWLWLALLVGFPLLIAAAIEQWRLREFKIESRHFFDEIVFELRVGQSLRAGLERIFARNQCGFYSHEIIEKVLHGVSQHPQYHDPCLVRRHQELVRLLNINSKVVDKVLFLRSMYVLQEKFRRKSRAATQQVKSQAVVVTLLYFILLIGQIRYSNLRIDSFWVILSAILLCGGLLLMRWILRSFKWKV